MKNFIYIITLFTILGCTDADILSKEYPTVLMKEVLSDESGVEFVGQITNLGNLPITAHGFVWSEGLQIDSSEIFSYRLDSDPTIGEYRLRVNSDFKRYGGYAVRPYISTSQITVVGNLIQFTSQGSLAPTIDDFYPKIASAGDTITIVGANFSHFLERNEVRLGSYLANVISVDFEEIKFVLPEKLTQAGTVQISLTIGENTVTTTDYIQIKSTFEIFTFSPKSGFIGEAQIAIKGSGFQSTNTKVKIGSYVTLLEVSSDELLVQLPQLMAPGEFSIEIEVNGNVVSSLETFEVKSRWTKLKDFPGTERIGPFIARVDNHLFMIGGVTTGYTNEVWQYNIDQDQWTQLSSFPGGGRAGAIGFLIGKIIYFGLGTNHDDFWSFDTETLEWEQLPDYKAISNPIAFAWKNLGYLVGGSDDSIYQYSPQDGWSKLGSISEGYTLSSVRDSHFEINDELFILNYVNGGTTSYTYQLLKFSIDSPDYLQPIGSVPFNTKDNDAITFVINDFVYVGEGSSNGKSEFLKWNYLSEEWSPIENFRGGRRTKGTISFSYLSYGYVGFGVNPTFGSKKRDLWKFDPN